jgi:hypothetical protein
LDFVKSMPMTRLLLTTPVLGRSDSGSGGRELRLTTAEDWTCEECNTVVSIARSEDKSDVIANHAATCDSKATLSPDFAMELMQPEVFLEWAAPAPAGTLAGAEGRVVVGEGKTPVGRGVMGLLDQAVSHGRKQLVFNLSSYSPLRLTVTRVGLNVSQLKHACAGATGATAAGADKSGGVAIKVGEWIQLPLNEECELYDGDEVALLPTRAERLVVRVK